MTPGKTYRHRYSSDVDMRVEEVHNGTNSLTLIVTWLNRLYINPVTNKSRVIDTDLVIVQKEDLDDWREV